MNPNQVLSHSPIHKGTRDYVQNLLTKQEERILVALRLQTQKLEDKINDVLESHRDRADKQWNEILQLKQDIGKLQASAVIAVGPITELEAPCSLSAARRHTEDQIREKILELGHKVRWRKTFTSRHLAEDLEEVLELWPADSELCVGGRGETRFEKTVSDMVHGWRTKPELYGECPFDKIKPGGRHYRIKEGWKWSNQTP